MKIQKIYHATKVIKSGDNTTFETIAYTMDKDEAIHECAKKAIEETGNYDLNLTSQLQGQDFTTSYKGAGQFKIEQIDLVSKTTVIDEDIFFSLYQPKKNHLDSCAGWDGCAYETFGDDLNYILTVNQTKPRSIWTLLEIDGHFVIQSGFHTINRFGYFVTKLERISGLETIEMED